MSTPAFTAGQVWAVDSSVRIDFTADDKTTDTPPAPKYNQNGARVTTNKGPALYCKVGTGGCSAGDLCLLSQSVSTGLMTSTYVKTADLAGAAKPQRIAVAIAACSAADYGWFLTGPFNLVPVNIANSIASGSDVTTTTTSGQGGSGGTIITGLALLEASAAAVLTGCVATQELAVNLS